MTGGEPGSALGRLVAQENTASDLLAFLFERDPAPLVRLLGLPGGTYRCRREVKGAGRLDLVVFPDGRSEPAAVLELKGASDVHGDQLERYQAWAESHDPAPELFYCTLDGDSPEPPWRALGLVELFGAWEGVEDPHTAWLAGEITGLLRRWDREADGFIGRSTGWYVPDLVSRRTARDLDEALRAAYPGDGFAEAVRTMAGNPELIAGRHFPPGSGETWIGVDVRSPGRTVPGAAWLFRPCVDVRARELPEHEAALEAHDLATRLLPMMVLPAVKAALTERGRNDLADALTARGHDGLARRPDPTVLAAWRARLESADPAAVKHPVFRFDGRRRLATEFKLDVTGITRADLAELTLAVIDHLK